MNKKHILLIATITLSTLFFSFRFTKEVGRLEDYSPPRSNGPAASGLGDRTGSPIGGSGASCTNCHGGGNFSPTISITVLDNTLTPVTSYVSGQNYTVEYTVTNGVGSPTGFGMQSLAMSPNTGNIEAGNFTSTTTANTRISPSGGRKYVEQQGLSTTGVFKVNWTAPNAGFGNVSFYARGLAGNGGGTGGDDTSPSTTLNLTESCTPNSGIDLQTACDTFTWIDGNTYTSDNNTATHTETNVSGCDSVVTLNLTINNSSSSNDIQTACDSYTWIDGNTYTSSNNSVTHIVPNAAGCDSVITLNLTINNSDNVTDVQTACNSYTWIDGNTYTSSNNTATQTETNVAGCDSIITLDLTINNPTSGTDVQIACTSLDWIDGNTYTSNNNTATYTLTNAGGCDSIVTLDLTISSIINSTDVQTACETFTWTDGNTYTTNNNTASQTLTSVQGCDSIVTLDLTILNTNAGTDTQVACESYTWIDGNIYTANNNTATFTLTNTAGCDSIVTLDLTINNLITTVTQSGVQLSSDEPGAIYQWYNCSDMIPISGANNQTYTAITNGNYAVTITKNGCSDNSNCFTVSSVGVLENNFGNNFNIYPNPTDGNFSVDLGEKFKTVSITITDLNGKLVQTKKYDQSQLLNLNIEQPKGVYQLLIESNNKKALIKLIKE